MKKRTTEQKLITYLEKEIIELKDDRARKAVVNADLIAENKRLNKVSLSIANAREKDKEKISNLTNQLEEVSKAYAMLKLKAKDEVVDADEEGYYPLFLLKNTQA